MRLLKKQKTENPSIQGVWNPFINKQMNIAIENFPSKNFEDTLAKQKSATEKILELVNKKE